MGFNLTITWTEGKSHLIADALSRAPVAGNIPICQVGLGTPILEEDELFPERELAEVMVRAVAVPAMTAIRDAAKLEPYSTWIRDFRTGENFKKSPLRSVASRLTLVDGLLGPGWLAPRRPTF